MNWMGGSKKKKRALTKVTSSDLQRQFFAQQRNDDTHIIPIISTDLTSKKVNVNDDKTIDNNNPVDGSRNHNRSPVNRNNNGSLAGTTTPQEIIRRPIINTHTNRYKYQPRKIKSTPLNPRSLLPTSIFIPRQNSISSNASNKNSSHVKYSKRHLGTQIPYRKRAKRVPIDIQRLKCMAVTICQPTTMAHENDPVHTNNPHNDSNGSDDRPSSGDNKIAQANIECSHDLMTDNQNTSTPRNQKNIPSSSHSLRKMDRPTHKRATNSFLAPKQLFMHEQQPLSPLPSSFSPGPNQTQLPFQQQSQPQYYSTSSSSSLNNNPHRTCDTQIDHPQSTHLYPQPFSQSGVYNNHQPVDESFQGYSHPPNGDHYRPHQNITANPPTIFHRSFIPQQPPQHWFGIPHQPIITAQPQHYPPGQAHQPNNAQNYNNCPQQLQWASPPQPPPHHYNNPPWYGTQPPR